MSKKSKAQKRSLQSSVQNSDQAINNSTLIANGLTEAVMGSGFGTGNQLSQADTVFENIRTYLVSNLRTLLSQAYVEIGIVKTIVDVPVDDALRGGVEIKSKQLSPEEIELLQSTIEQEDDIGTMAEALKWDRLFGGAGVLILTGQESNTPLDLKSLKEGDPLEFRAVDMWELFHNLQNITGDGLPIDGINGNQFFKYYGKDIHRSRVLTTKGIKAPSFIRPRLRGWGISVVEVLVRSINQFLKANDLTFEVLDEFKVDVFKIKNLANTLLSPDGAAKIQKRIQLANQQKNFQNAITMDAEDDYIQKELSFAGISETMVGIRMQIASDLRMPLTKVFGISSAGFSSGEDDIENYNAMVESTVRSKCKHHIIEMIKLRCQQRLGFIPEDLQVTFKPLRMLSSEQEENVKTQKFTRLLQARQAGEISSKEFKDACNKGNLLEIQLDSSSDLEDEQGDQDDQEETNDEGALPKGLTKSSQLAAKEAPEAAS